MAAGEQATYPETAELLLSQTYLDNTFGGADTEEAALQLRGQLIDLLKTATIELDKWLANKKSVLQGLTKAEWNEIAIDLSESVSTLSRE